ncbi:hypothetical protein [Flavobacterium quisquiliarum]|uniref:Lipoprotein n=1 Tax=Flavobacterium quisquiliarum TaxID=1834436 RepID=A0ABV8WBJ6_9FLAO|nr:hypothetical protein [Flavobacterium quisquiliarum]MBW1657947.1 hypothetical protein [Flavobacterium quisquiliarum]NWL01004.1 hypothetical protein [Flavobacterium collinsii]
MRISLTLLIFLFISCKQDAEKKSATEIKENLEISKTENIKIEPQAEPNTLVESFKEFRNAIYQRDKVKVKEFIDFPIYNDNNEIWYLGNMADDEFFKKAGDKVIPFPETEFDKYYDKIFSNYFLRGILKIKTGILFSKGEFETIELTDKDTKFKIYATYNDKENEIILNLAIESPIKVNDGENDSIENSESNVIYYFKIENGKDIRFKQIRVAG